MERADMYESQLGKHFLKINSNICCKFNLTLQRSLHHNEAADALWHHNHDVTQTGRDVISGNGYPNIFFDRVSFDANISWTDVKRITTHYVNDATVFCDVDNTSYPENLTDVNFSLITEEDYLRSFLGDRYISVAALVILTIIYSVIFLTGVLGNLCTCIVIVNNRFLHTATNYYLFSLAVSDVMTLLLALPQELLAIWESYPFKLGVGFCFVKTYVSEMTAYASILTITAFTIDRYMAICHPLKSQRLSSLSRAVKIIILLWVVALACALPYPIHMRLLYDVMDPCTDEPIMESLLCTIPGMWRDRMSFMLQFSTFAFFFVPMIIITILYVLIGLALMKNDQWGEGQKNKKAAASAVKSKKAVLKMLVAVVIAFFLCWAPFHTQRLMTIYIDPAGYTEGLITLMTYLFYVSGVLYFFNSTLNPILYNVMSKRYRKAFRRTLHRCIKGKHSDYSETSIFRSNQGNTSITVYTNHRFQVRDQQGSINEELAALTDTTKV